MNLFIFSFGKLKTPGMREAADHYIKYLSQWTNVQEIELKPMSVPDKSDTTKKRIQSHEASLLTVKLGSIMGTKTPRFFLMDETGSPMRTQEWSDMAGLWEMSGGEDTALCIGSSLGFPDELKKKARGLISLGPQTMPHELVRVILLEQLFRAWSVLHHHPYHNG